MALYAVYITLNGERMLVGREDKICPLFMERTDAVKSMARAVVHFGEKMNADDISKEERQKFEQALKTIEVKRVIVNEYKESGSVAE